MWLLDCFTLLVYVRVCACKYICGLRMCSDSTTLFYLAVFGRLACGGLERGTCAASTTNCFGSYPGPSPHVCLPGFLVLPVLYWKAALLASPRELEGPADAIGTDYSDYLGFALNGLDGPSDNPCKV